MWLFIIQFGLFNLILTRPGQPASQWIYNQKTVIPSLIFMSTWNVRNIIIIFLAGLQGIPGNCWKRFRLTGVITGIVSDILLRP